MLQRCLWFALFFVAATSQGLCPSPKVCCEGRGNCEIGGTCCPEGSVCYCSGVDSQKNIQYSCCSQGQNCQPAVGCPVAHTRGFNSLLWLLLSRPTPKPTPQPSPTPFPTTTTTVRTDGMCKSNNRPPVVDLLGNQWQCNESAGLPCPHGYHCEFIDEKYWCCGDNDAVPACGQYGDCASCLVQGCQYDTVYGCTEKCAPSSIANECYSIIGTCPRHVQGTCWQRCGAIGWGARDHTLPTLPKLGSEKTGTMCSCDSTCALGNDPNCCHDYFLYCPLNSSE